MRVVREAAGAGEGRAFLQKKPKGVVTKVIAAADGSHVSAVQSSDSFVTVDALHYCVRSKNQSVMKTYSIDFRTTMLRFYGMMALVFIAFFLHVYWLALLALPVLLSVMLGIKFKDDEPTTSARQVEMRSDQESLRTQAS